MKHLLLTAVMTLGFATAAHACGDALAVDNAWVRAPMKGKDMTAAFFDVTNKSDAAQTLTAVEAEGAAAEMHTTVEENGVFRMRHLKEVEVPAGATVRFEPKALHIMLMKLEQPLAEGDAVAMTLRCADGGSVELAAPVKTAR